MFHGIQGMFAEFCGMGDQPLVLGIRSNSHVNLVVDHIECIQNSFLTQGGYDAGPGCCFRSPHKDHLMVFMSQILISVQTGEVRLGDQELVSCVE